MNINPENHQELYGLKNLSYISMASFDDIKNEYELIKEGKYTLSANLRKLVVERYKWEQWK